MKFEGAQQPPFVCDMRITGESVYSGSPVVITDTTSSRVYLVVGG